MAKGKKETKKNVRAIFEGLDRLTAEDIQKSEILKNLLLLHVPQSIQYALENGKIFATVFEINNSGEYIEIHKTFWVSALETTVLWLVEIEDYERCAEIQSLITAIKTKARTKTIELENPTENG
jgi:hypothetical protein